MKKKILKKLALHASIAGLLSGLLAPYGAGKASANALGEGFDYTKVPKLLITELVPDSSNVAGSDAYEFVEVYNNSSRPVSLKDYSLDYHYLNSSSSDVDAVWSLTSLADNPVIPSKQSVVLWVMNSVNTGLTAADFNGNYGTSLVEGGNLFRVSGGGGMHNSAVRDFFLKDSSGKVVVSASYQNDDQTKPDKGIFYEYPMGGSAAMQMVTTGDYAAGLHVATPGMVESQFMPERTSDDSASELAIQHVPVTEAIDDIDLKLTAGVTANVYGDPSNVTAAVYYKLDSEASYTRLPMSINAERSANDNFAFEASISKERLMEDKLQYYMEANDGWVTKKTEVYTAQVKVLDFDPAKVPPLLVTELTPNTTNVNGADGYEFIEIYNNTDKTINLKDYKIYYRYTDSGPDADLVWRTDREEMMIGPGKTLVFWVINNGNGSKTVADFNANFHTNLTEDQDIYKIYSDGMANGSKRGVAIGTNTHADISVAYYDGALTNETPDNKGIQYKYPANSSTNMIKLSSGTEYASPGSVNPAQVPQVPVSVPDDNEPPMITDMTGTSSIDQSQNLAIVGDAGDNQSVKSVKLYYKSDQQSEYSSRYLYVDYNDTMYHFTLYSPDLIGKSSVQYYYVVSDGTHEVTSDIYKINITGGPDRSALRLNIKDGDLIRGTKTVKGTAEQAGPDTLRLDIDGKPLTSGTYHAAEKDAFFAFDANSVNYYFKNGVTIGDEILYTFMDPINAYTTLSVPIADTRLKAGDNVISVRAGTKSSPFDDRPEENKDDFTVKNIRLVFADGTVVYDPGYANPVKEIKMGDSAGRFPVVDFHFNLPDEQLKSKAYDWDTTKLPDGPHQVAVQSAEYGQKAVELTVDNTAPAIVATVEDGKTYRGEFTLNAEITDALAGVESTEAALDGEKIELPYTTSSSKLKPGNHTLTIKATDKIGNAADKNITFNVPNENPLKPELVFPVSEQSGAAGDLTVKVQDPTGDPMKVSFYKGYLFDASHQAGFTAYKNASEVEPPGMLKPEGEQAFTQEEYSQIASADGQYLNNDSDGKFPYHRFEIKLDPSVKATDSVVIDWQGKSLEGRQVSMYSWSPVSKVWNKLDGRVAGNEDFALTAEVKAGDYAVDGMIHVIVQDQIPVSQDPYDFSFVWMSDTQYYSESYPEIYEGNVKWIVDHKDDMNIKYVIHTGDVVDEADKEYQWQEADKDMKVLEDAKVPYGVLAGNHDVSHQNSDYTKFYQYFGNQRFKSQPTFGGSYLNNRGHYDLISAGGNDFVVVYMGWDIRDEDIQWVDEVVKKFPDRKAILNFHEYLLVSGNRAPIADKIYERVVVPNPNVIAVLSGHYHDAEELVDSIDDNGDGVADRKVYQMLADYQGAEKGGLGYIRLLQFDVKNNKIHVKTYSPYLDDYNFYEPGEHPGKDEFDLDVNLQPMKKRVATDYFGVKVYTGEQIDEKTGVASGNNASIHWEGLKAGGYYQWYAVAQDAYSGSARSDIWGFTAGKVSEAPVPTQTPATASPAPTPTPTPTPSATPAPTVPPTAVPFNDVGSKYDWAKEAIDTLTEKGIFKGTSDTTFEPGKNMTRADFMVLLVRMLDLKADFSSNFSDVRATDYYYEAAGIVRQLGIAAGVGGGKFNPKEAISRQDLMVLLMRALEVNGKLKLSGTETDLSRFRDKSKVASYAKDAVAAMINAGIVQGSGSGLNPAGTATRAETAQILYRVYNKVK
ncbi:S-layer homology domain-containing protein [Paenibacillus rhizophilus]|uniref:Metallophosphoesterase n=1 Tax=Paenibacillus rhizophilus TaxID=1850366 RepID=A0A3N9P5K1_9BACL|nr:S-layer homology domain-containing protein [Paenibacillus rhizophilus]RQW10597.1 hypothetical protein EH198_15160 [Paenibacillus rhizophilus]